MKPQPRVKLSKLRDIGWTLWDPIGLLVGQGKWDDEDNLSFADEYDRYLISAASQLRRGIPKTEIVNYLVDIEANYMGLGTVFNSYQRAHAVVEAIQADKDIWTYPDEQGRFK